MLASGAGMDASAALSELVGLSTQVVEAVVTGPDGTIHAARTAGDDRSQALAAHGSDLLDGAATLRPGGPPVERVHVDTERGSVVVVSDGERAVVATTVAEPTAGLVAHDLGTLLARVRGDDA